MSKMILAQRYANALCEELENEDQLNAALSTIESFARAFDSNHELRTVLTNPSISIDNRSAIFSNILDNTNPRSLAKNLIQILFERGRLNLITDVAKALRTTIDLRLNRVVGTLTSTRELSSKQHESIQQSISTFIKKDVQLEMETNPDLLGGVVVRIGGTVIDGSLRTRLVQLKNALLAEENGPYENSGH